MMRKLIIVLALCGVAANVKADAYGTDFERVCREDPGLCLVYTIGVIDGWTAQSYLRKQCLGFEEPDDHQAFARTVMEMAIHEPLPSSSLRILRAAHKLSPCP